MKQDERLDTHAREAITEAAYQFAICAAEADWQGARAAAAILHAIATKSQRARVVIRDELSAYAMPFCAVEMLAAEGGAA